MWRSTEVVVFLFVFILGIGRSTQGAVGPVLINEFMAANSSTMADPQGQFDDWVELYNTGDSLIDVAGMYLTDDPKSPTKWQIPAGMPNSTRIPAKGLLVIWLDGDTMDPGLHASFRLDAAGDQIALFDKDGLTLLDHVVFKKQRSDVSYGRSPSGADDWRYMMLATPGNFNSVPYEGLVADTKFSQDRGFYDGPFEVTITCKTPDAIIYYTLDGSEPGSATGRLPKGMIYTGPILISRTTCLRARAIKEGWLPSDVDTHTYLFLADAMTTKQAAVVARGYPDKWFGSYPADYEMDPEVYNDPTYSNLMADAMLAIPTLSLVTNKDHFFSQAKDAATGGIYIYTGHSSTGGQDWERPVSAELFTADGAREFHLDCGIRIQGGESRNPQKMPKHSFSLRFRGEYGSSRFEFPLFDGSPVDKFESLQLRGFFNNTWNHWAPDQRQRAQYIRDQWMHDSMLDMGHADGGCGFYVHLYINGIYWGLYDLQERPVSSHYAAYNGGDPDRIDAINGGRATSGTTQVWQETRSVVQGKNWARIQEMIDLDNFIDWTLLNLFAGNVDLKTDGNWRAAGGGPDKRPWRFYVWDGERVCENVNQNGNSPASDPTGFFTALSSIEEFRIRFGDRVHKHLFNGGALTAERNAQRYSMRVDEIGIAVIAESARWGDYRRDLHQYQSGPYDLYTRDKYWIPEKNRLLNDYFPRRTNIALSQFRSRGLYPSLDAPVFGVNGQYQHGGHADAGASLSMQAAGGAIWYTLDGSDPRVSGAVAEPTNQGKLVAENAAKRVLIPTAAISDAWKGGQMFDDSSWISGSGGVGFERSTGFESLIGINVQSQMYSRNATCYVRIPFTTTLDNLVNLSVLTLNVRYDDGFIVYLNGTEIARKNFTGNPTWNSAANTQNPDDAAVLFEAFDVSSSLGSLKLGQNILAVHAMNQSTTSSDFLFSAELVSGASAGGPVPSGVSPTAVKYAGPVALSKTVQVKARVLSGSTWSALNETVFAVGPVAESLRINEIMYHPAGDPNAEYVELTNIGSQPINLAMVRFTKGIEFFFQDYELRAGGYCLVAKDISSFMARYGSTLPLVGQYTGSLDNAGERIELVDAAGAVIQSFEYQDDWFDLTDGWGFSLTVRDPRSPSDPGERDAWRPSAKAGGSPGKDDSGQVPEPGSIVINELMTNPAPGASDWIELHNATGHAINISGWFLSDDGDDPTKYRVADGTSIPAGGYLVLFQDQHFGNAADPGCNTPFGLSKDGETVCLHGSSADGVLIGYCEREKFGASEPGVSLGRWPDGTGTYDFVPLSEPTPGEANAAPL
jgi:hypothetical protein